MKKFNLIRTTIIIILAVSLVSCSGISENKIQGKWKFDHDDNGYDAFFYDLEFYDDGTFFIGSPFLLTNTFRYEIIEPGTLKISVGALSEIIKFTLSGNSLIFHFKSGDNYYNEIR